VGGEDVGGGAVEEEAVVADDHGAAGEILQRLFQGAEGLDVEIVGRLVELSLPPSASGDVDVFSESHHCARPGS
jgi:hypothetical protein